jgi:hypothetical protein
MLDLLSLDPRVQSADRRAAMVIGYVGLGALTFLNVATGGGSRSVLTGMVLALAGLPWWFAFGGRRRLLGDALVGRTFAARGDRAGIWATAPVSGALLTLLFVSGLPFGFALLACLLGGVLYTAGIAWAEQRYERAILLDLTVLEQRFRRITDNRPAARLVAASAYDARGGVGAAHRDLEVQVRPGRKARRADGAD